MWELLVLIIVVIAVHAWEYRTSVQEYTFAQPATLDRHDELSTVLQEKTPIAVEIGSLPWRPEVATKAPWTVGVAQSDGVMNMSVEQWLASGAPIANHKELAEEMELTTGLVDLDNGRPWWWLPELRDCTVDVMGPDRIVPLTWITAERHWIGCSHGEPLTLWLVHSRYRRYLPTGSPKGGVNPWTLTVADAPWIGRVQYIEVTVKPGWCIGLPAHWGFAAKVTEGTSWTWQANQHSLFSFSLGLIGNAIRSGHSADDS